ncbi:hypothetical protein FHS96_005547 [Sphingomonas zeicaulis]|uniref:ABC-three component system protein n=1 Tax=Sphingomonas zeicaulis TaxID=1632740 RepID=UPI003D1CC9B5
MDTIDYDWEWQKMRLANALHDLVGDPFEQYFQRIAKAVWREDFTATTPMGSRGDLKCDGYRHSAGMVFQCYGPRYGKVDVEPALKKIREDFTGAKDHWQDALKAWRFVMNIDRDKAPSEVALEIKTLSTRLKVEGLPWGRAEIFGLAQDMPAAERIAMFGLAPRPTDMAGITYENIGRALSLIKRGIAEDKLDPVVLPPDLTEKADWNALPHGAQQYLSVGQAGANRVHQYLMDQVDPQEAERMAEGFKARYGECRASAMEPDRIFQKMIVFAGGASDDSDRDVAALSIVAHFFSTCEIFEQPPAKQAAT